MRWPDLALSVTLVLASGVAVLGSVVVVTPWNAPSQWGTPSWVGAGVVGTCVAGYLSAAVAVAVAAGVRRLPQGHVIHLGDPGVIALGLSVPMAGVAPVWLAAALQSLQGGVHGLPTFAVAGVVGVSLVTGAAALALNRTEVQVCGAAPDRIVSVLRGRGIPTVRTFKLSDGHVETVVVRTGVRPSWHVRLIDPGGRVCTVGRTWGEGATQALIGQLRGTA